MICAGWRQIKWPQKESQQLRAVLRPMRIPYAGSKILLFFSKTIVSAQRGEMARLRVANKHFYLEQSIQ